MSSRSPRRTAFPRRVEPYDRGMVLDVLGTLGALFAGAAFGACGAYLRVFPSWGLRLAIVAVAFVVIFVVPDRVAPSPTVGWIAILVGLVGGAWLGGDRLARRYSRRPGGTTPTA